MASDEESGWTYRSVIVSLLRGFKARQQIPQQRSFNWIVNSKFELYLSVYLFIHLTVKRNRRPVNSLNYSFSAQLWNLFRLSIWGSLVRDFIRLRLQRGTLQLFYHSFRLRFQVDFIFQMLHNVLFHAPCVQRELWPRFQVLRKRSMFH